MSFGSSYADIYDALYHDKDYEQETAFVDFLLGRHAKAKVKQILDLGCGTGTHDIVLARRGYRVHGVDMSPQMLAHAERHRAELLKPFRDLLSFSLGDIRDLDLKCKFDAVISLFHVMSYQTTDADLLAALTTARNHLRMDGLFLFDFWHGPAVLSQGVQKREKRIEKGGLSALRRSNPVWDKERDIVKVNYQLEIADKASGRVEMSNEEHVVRYLFRDRLAFLMMSCGFEILEEGEWLTGQRPEDDVFAVYAMARAR
jgi:SAM-dependent methyltransferase